MTNPSSKIQFGAKAHTPQITATQMGGDTNIGIPYDANSPDPDAAAGAENLWAHPARSKAGGRFDPHLI